MARLLRPDSKTARVPVMKVFDLQLQLFDLDVPLDQCFAESPDFFLLSVKHLQ